MSHTNFVSYKTLQRVEVFRKAYSHVHFSTIGNRPKIPKAGLWKLGMSTQNERSELLQ